MKYLFYIALSFLVFTACEDEKEMSPYPMNELDGTFWDAIKAENFYYDENSTLIRQNTYGGGDISFFFKGNFVLFMFDDSACFEGRYFVSLKDHKFMVGSYNVGVLEEYNESYFIISKKTTTTDGYLIHKEWYSRTEPKQSWEEYIEDRNLWYRKVL